MPALQDVAQLEVRLREVSDMLYLKQEQLERLAADKAAQQLRLERELALAREQAAGTGTGRYHVESSSGTGRGSLNADELIPMDALGAPYQRLAQVRCQFLCVVKGQCMPRMACDCSPVHSK